jgi:hypothetical protein
VTARPGIGSAAAVIELGALSSASPLVVWPGAGIVATELVLYFEPVSVTVPARISAGTSPLVWPHWAAPQKVNP